LVLIFFRLRHESIALGGEIGGHMVYSGYRRIASNERQTTTNPKLFHHCPH
jgi:hypothetical protein